MQVKAFHSYKKEVRYMRLFYLPSLFFLHSSVSIFASYPHEVYHHQEPQCCTSERPQTTAERIRTKVEKRRLELKAEAQEESSSTYAERLRKLMKASKQLMESNRKIMNQINSELSEFRTHVDKLLAASQ
jgi:hypothetical protein